MPSERSRYAQFLFTHLTGNGHAAWRDCWLSVVTDILAKYAYGTLDFRMGRADSSQFNRLDDPISRSRIVPIDEEAIDACYQELRQHRRSINELLEAQGAGWHGQGTGQFKRLLIDEGVIEDLIRTANSTAVITTTNLVLVWRRVAHRIATEVHSTESSAQPDSDWLVQNKLLMAEFFFCTELDSGRLVSDRLNRASESIHGPRGGLIRMLSLVSEEGVRDRHVEQWGGAWRVPAVAVPNDLFLDAVHQEAADLPQGEGLMHRILDKDGPVGLPVGNNLGVTVEHVKQGRKLMYRQYESCVLTYMTLGAIERLLRAAAQQQGIQHTTPDRPIPVLQWLNQLGLTSHDEVQYLWDAEQSNFRNQAMHGSLLDVESKRQEVSLQQRIEAIPESGRPLGTDPYVPEHIAARCLDCLSQLAQELQTRHISAVDFSWQSQQWLTPDEIDFGSHLHCDFLDGYALAEAWRSHIAAFVRTCMPCMSIFTQTGVYGWVRGYDQRDSFLLFMVWGIVFEALYRSTAQLCGIPVLQRSRYQGTYRRFQYCMLDETEAGLARPEVMDRLLEHIESNDRDNARTTLSLAIKARNAMCHGSVPQFNEHLHLAVGHLYLKSVQTLMTAALHHMTSVGAYYYFEKYEHDDHVKDWIKAEGDALQLFSRHNSQALAIR
ncbi:MAG: hypothetical protein GC159_16235 [Phycisphaera sp.]|nr:hypothetical protein [Phycisphaera sp.]